MITIYCRALLFDMDGVLIDSTPAVARVWRRWALEHGLDPTDVVRRAHGRPSVETIRHYYPNDDYEALDKEVEHQEVEELEGIVPLPGSQELLSRLPPSTWTVVTSATRVLAEVRLRTAGLPIPEKMVTASEISNGKPHPEPYLKAAAALGFPAAECVVVEDVPAGIRAGKSAGAEVIAFPTTFQPSELIEAGADWVVNHCGDLSVIETTPKLQLDLQAKKH